MVKEIIFAAQAMMLSRDRLPVMITRIKVMRTYQETILSIKTSISIVWYEKSHDENTVPVELDVG